MEGLIRDLALIMLLGAGATLVMKWLKQPVVLGYIVAGFLASPHFAYLPSVTSHENIEFWAEIGVIVLLFTLGLEFSFKKLMNAGSSAIVTSLLTICGMVGAGYMLGLLLGMTPLNALFLGGMLSISSTTIIIKALNDLGLKHRKFASLVLAVLIVEDLFAVLLMVLLSSIATGNSVAGGEMLYSVSKLVFFLIIWFACGVFVLPSLLNWLRSYLNTETLLVISMGLCLGMAVFSVYCGFSLALGAFVMGSILAGTSFAEKIEHVTQGVKDLFGAVFFISVGMMVNPQILVEHPWSILIISLLVVVGGIIFGTIGMLLTGQSLPVALECGFSLTQIGEFSFIIATLGMSLGVLDSTIYPIIVAVSVLTTFTTPYLIKCSFPASKWVERHLPQKWRFLINRYSDEASTEGSSSKLWKMVIKRYAWRLVIYVIVLTALSLLSLRLLLPFLLSWNVVWGKLVTVGITLFVMSPFLIALTMPASQETERQRLRQANARFDVPLIIMSVFKVLIALAFVIFLISSIYSIAIGWCVTLGLTVMVGLAFSKRLHKRIAKIENRFLNNLNERELRKSGRNNNIVSNIHLAYITVGHDCPFVGEKLKNSGLRSKYGVSISSILRGDKLTLVPTAEARIFPGDVLGIIGTDEEIQEVIPVLESQSTAEIPSKLDDVKFTHIKLSEKSPLVEEDVGNADLSGRYGALLVAVEREGDFHQPRPDMIFEAGDTIWLVGDTKKLAVLQ